MKKYWKSFKIGDLFERSGKHIIKEAIKSLNTSKEKTEKFYIANITASSSNNGISCWLENLGSFQQKKFKNKLTITTNCYVGYCFFQENEFVSTGDNNIIEIKNNILENKLKINSYKFLAKYLTLIFSNKFHSWGRKLGAGNDFNREIILLPVIECKKEDSIWEEDDGTFITLDTETIERIMKKIEAIKKSKTIDIYEKDKKEYEDQLNKLKTEDFKKEYSKVYWKSFKVGDLFERSGKNSIKTPLKNLDLTKQKTEKNTIALITMSNVNNGIGGWLEDIGEVKEKKNKNKITLVTGINAGVSFFQENEFVTLGSQTIEMRNESLNRKMTKNSFKFLAKYFKSLWCTRLYGWEPGASSAKDGRGRSISTGNDFNREIILLPVFIDENNEEQFSTKTMEYLYLKSMIKKQQNKIDDYNEKIKELQ